MHQPPMPLALLATLVAVSAPIGALSLLAADGAATAHPDGCSSPAPGRHVCEWVFLVAPGDGPAARELPPIGPGILSVTLAAGAPPCGGWRIENAAGTWLAGGHPCEPLGAGMVSEGPREWTRFVDLEPGSSTRFLLVGLPRGSQNPTDTGPLPGQYQITLRFHELVGTAAAGDRAGGPEDPQLLDAAEDAPAAYLDLLAAWFDQPVLDDGLIEVGLALANLTSVPSEGPDSQPWEQVYQVRWSCLGETYTVIWHYGYEFAGVGLEEKHWSALLLATGAGNFRLTPKVDAERGVLTVRVPLNKVGDPSPDARFDNFSASAEQYVWSRNGQNQLPGYPRDVADTNVRPFAVGGPVVWAQLRGEGNLVATGAALPWYRDPFGAEHLPDVLQVLGAVIAAATFGGGFLVVRARRARLNRHLDEIDAAVALHAGDPEATLRALDALADRFDRMLREGRLREGEEAILETRIDRAGYRILRERDRAR